MDITYIFHSSFLVETNSCYYLFDYYKGKLPVLKKEKPILVLPATLIPTIMTRRCFPC